MLSSRPGGRRPLVRQDGVLAFSFATRPGEPGAEDRLPLPGEPWTCPLREWPDSPARRAKLEEEILALWEG